MKTVPIGAHDAMEFVGQIIDIFEDFLEARHVILANPEKTYTEEPAIIYGTDYGDLQHELGDMMVNWGIIEAI